MKWGYIKIAYDLDRVRTLVSILANKIEISQHFWEVEVWERDGSGSTFPSYIRYADDPYHDFPIAYGSSVIHIHEPDWIEFLNSAAQARWTPLQVYQVVNG
jgi:hypothetical protein